jgi:hypothetical protein
MGYLTANACWTLFSLVADPTRLFAITLCIDNELL